MTKLIPYENYCIYSRLTREELLLRLLHTTLSANEYVHESGNRLIADGRKTWSKPYWGYIRRDSFEIERLITYYNLSAPKIYGKIKPSSTGTIIHIRISPPGVTLFFIGVIFLALLAALLVSVVTSFRLNQLQTGVVVAAGMMAFVYLLLLGAFKAESALSQKFLSNLFS
jgi:hypothetical protein